tara:strand:- start:25109 stop:26146 length:1038 start_codon:yes stop_codon:yes gene_type:complete
MKNKRPAIKDIASAIGVSITTVSFVLNGKAEEKKISKEVTSKILKYAEKIKYKPNQLAQGLRTGKSKIIVFMVEDFYHFFAKVATIIEDLAYNKGYKVIFCTNENKDEKSIDLINLYKDIKVDGYIIIPSGGLMPKIKELIEEGIPVVLFDRYFEELDTNQVTVDNEDASFNATQHLIDNNFKNIGFVTIDLNQTQMQDRLCGYKAAIQKNLLQENIIKLPFEKYTLTRTNIEAKIKKYIENNPQLDALFFSTNYLTISGLNTLKNNFPQYTEKMGIISFDDLDFFEFYNPSISAIGQPYNEIANAIMDLMLNLLENPKKSERITKIKLKTHLEIRDSTRVRGLV